MPKNKYATDEERMNATREYRKRYYAANRETLVGRSKKWRDDRKANQAQEQPVAQAQ